MEEIDMSKECSVKREMKEFKQASRKQSRKDELFRLLKRAAKLY